MDALTRIEGHADSVGEEARIGIVVASDRASSNEYEDEGGPAILHFLIEATKSPLDVHYRCIPDSMAEIEFLIIRIQADPNSILTCFSFASVAGGRTGTLAKKNKRGDGIRVSLDLDKKFIFST